MGRRGPPKEPTVLKLLKGNPGRRPLPTREPKPSQATPTDLRCPKYLPDIAKAEWKRLAPQLKKLGLLTKVDRTALEGYCLAYARAVQAADLVAKQGFTIVTDKGFVVQHPGVAIERNAWAAVRQFAREFGFTPSSRTGIELPDPPKKGEDHDDFLTGGRRAAGS